MSRKNKYHPDPDINNFLKRMGNARGKFENEPEDVLKKRAMDQKATLAFWAKPENKAMGKAYSDYVDKKAKKGDYYGPLELEKRDLKEHQKPEWKEK